jgi:hypothetical protein
LVGDDVRGGAGVRRLEHGRHVDGRLADLACGAVQQLHGLDGQGDAEHVVASVRVFRTVPGAMAASGVVPS